MPTPIRKVLIQSYGGPEVIRVVNDTLPDPPAHHVQVKILYSGFAGADINMRLGTYPMQRKAPLTPGYCFVGTVHKLGPQCSQKFKEGDVVACLSVYDAQATYANQPEKYLVALPERIDYQVATALILDWNTAYGMVQQTQRHSPGGKKTRRVFIHGMSGAVGNALMVLCRNILGAEIYGTASLRNHEELRKMGATPFVYTDKNWIKAIKEIGGVHAVYDPLGFTSWGESYSILSSTEPSLLIGYGGNLHTLNKDHNSPVPSSSATIWPTIKLLSQNLKFWSKKSTTFYYISRDKKSFEPNLKDLFEMVRKEDVDVRIKRCFALDEVMVCHRDWTSLTGMGSVVVKVA